MPKETHHEQILIFLRPGSAAPDRHPKTARSTGMEDPPRFNHPPPVAPAPDSPAPGQPPSHSREDSHDGGSQFSEQNPLQGDIPASRIPVEPKKPKAVALHGWQRTVGVDEDFDPTIPVCLGAPGTGLFTAKAGQNNPAAGVGVGAVVDLGNAKVTRADKKEAKSLRLQPAAPDAAPLPYPRVAAVDTASESSSEASTDDDDPTGSRKKQQQQNNFETCSEASSDMSFLVNTASGSFLGNRGAFGRNIDPRIPATVGEEHLYNSLAEYFGKSRRNIPAGGAGGDAESAGGESSSRLSDLSGTAAGDKELSLRQGSGAGSSSTPLAGKAAGATPGSTTNSTTLSTSGGSGSGSTMNTNNSQTAIVPVDHHQPKKKGILRIRSRSSEAGGGGGGREGESKRREGSSRGLGSGAAVATEAMVEEGRLAKQASSEAAPLEPGRRLPKCKCLRRWPWKVSVRSRDVCRFSACTCGSETVVQHPGTERA